MVFYNYIGKIEPCQGHNLFTVSLALRATEQKTEDSAAGQQSSRTVVFKE